MSTPTNPTTAETGRLLSYADAVREAVEQEMDVDPSVFVMGLDVEDHVAIRGTTRGLVEKFGRDRVFHTPLSEDAMTGVAIGAAMAGMRPIHVHIRMDFLMLCMNQIVNIAAKAKYMYGGEVNVPMVVRSIIGKSWGQGAQHSQGLHAMFMHVPGLKVIAPSTSYHAKGCMIAAIRDNNPVIFIDHRMLFGTESYVPEEAYAFPLGQSRICQQGDAITIVGVSNMVIECLRAAELLRDVGIDATVIDPVTLMPLDDAPIINDVRKTKRLLVVDNAWTACGASAEITSRVAEVLGPDGVTVRRMGYAPTTCPTTPALEEHFYPNPATIAETAFAMVKPDAAVWSPDPEAAKLAYQLDFKGPF